ncbi:hypothetical protein [Jannaschia donghaensis]|uniref:hypothetical protein n=1 Tax=Jannaschia donghaensis TaxID=420998 RepID=UPI0006D7BB14|nr:hypothetical protein [Jannaschia donghaensis]
MIFARWEVIGGFDVASVVLRIQALDLFDAIETDHALVLNFEGNTQVELTGQALNDLPSVQID